VENIKRALQEIGCEGVDQIDLTQDRYRWRDFVDVVINLASYSRKKQGNLLNI
jgi:hypothetical protein